MVAGKRKSTDRINATNEIEHGFAVLAGGGRISRITEAQPCIFKHRSNIKERQLEAVQEANMKRLALECSECKKEEWQNEIEAEITQVRLSPFSTPRCFWFFDRHGPKKDRDKMIDVLVSRHGAYIIRPDLVPSRNASDKNMQMFIKSGRPWHVVILEFDDYSQEPDKLVREIHTLGRVLLEGRFTSSKSTVGPQRFQVPTHVFVFSKFAPTTVHEEWEDWTFRQVNQGPVATRTVQVAIPVSP